MLTRGLPAVAAAAPGDRGACRSVIFAHFGLPSAASGVGAYVATALPAWLGRDRPAHAAIGFASHGDPMDPYPVRAPVTRCPAARDKGSATGMFAAPADDAVTGKVSDAMLTGALTDDVLLGRLVDDVLARVPRPSPAPPRPKGAGRLIPFGTGSRAHHVPARVLAAVA